LLAAPLLAAGRPVLVCYGDSITAGYGLQTGQSFPDALQRDLDAAATTTRSAIRAPAAPPPRTPSPACAPSCSCIPRSSSSNSAATTACAACLSSQTRRNLDQVLTALESAHIKILLAGITLPPNYGQDYIQQFEQVFRDLAAKHHTAFVPMIYKDLVHVPGTIQPDGIHPTAKGSEIIARTLLPVLKPLLHSQGSEIQLGVCNSLSNSHQGSSAAAPCQRLPAIHCNDNNCP
jgi:acyl-CoA thioesterase-1